MNPYVRGYRRAARHLLDLGLLPAPCREEMRALWANSPEDRQLVTYIADRWAGRCGRSAAVADTPASRAGQLERRRDAALRLPPLPHSGRRDLLINWERR